ncbi:IS1634 family transposase, partial [Desulfosarcina sp. OttesenSCG-928-G10]|nr:IS1634 family transposase [Desulfosarcina sp. OttesenSCG-928-G10]
KYLSDHGFDEKATIYVADAALVSEKNLAKSNQMRFLTRLPARYAECGRVIEAAVNKGASAWKDIGIVSQQPGSAKRPAACYQYQEASVTLYEISYRAVVVHSSSHDKRRQKAVDTKIKTDRKLIDSRCKETLKTAFHCREDAEDAAKRLIKNTSALHDVKAQVVATARYGKGRPSSEKERTPIRTDYCIEATITENAAAIAKLRQIAGCFVLLTNLSSAADQEKYDGKTLLSLYKEQYGIEQNFGFIKDPAIVDSIFLKRPERIEVLGLILLISLLVWRLMEREMRRYLKHTGTQLVGWVRRKTTRVTSFMLTTKFNKVRLCRVNGELVLAQRFTDTQNAWLKALGVTPDDFLPPKRPQKIIKPPPEGC